MGISNIQYWYTTDYQGATTKTHYEIIWSNGDKSTILIQNAESNRHYQEILEWVADGNTITDNGGSN
jgi:hypothetical protein